MGYVSDAISSARRSVVYADRSGDAFERLSERARLANALHQAGDTVGAEALFDEAERIQADYDPSCPVLYSVESHRHCDLLLGKGEAAKVLALTSRTLPMMEQRGSLLDIGLGHLTLGRAHREGSPDAAHHLNQAVEYVLRAGELDLLPLALLARATDDDLAEVFTIATRSGMRLYLTDYHLIMARRDPANRQHHIQQAADLIAATGYHRRDPDLATLLAESS